MHPGRASALLGAGLGIAALRQAARPARPFVTPPLTPSADERPWSILRGRAAAPPCSEPQVAVLAIAATAALTAAAGLRTATMRGNSTAARAAKKFVPPAQAKAALLAEQEEPEPPPRPPFDAKKQVGVTAPLGYFDPLNFCKVDDEEGFRKLRASELKHGRVGMMAAAGSVAQYLFRIPILFDFVPSGLQAANSGNGKYGFGFVLAACAYLELAAWKEDDEREPGNFGDPLGFNIYDTDMRDKELNNGRMGMIAAAGIIAAELITGKSAVEQFGFGPSPYEIGSYGG